MSSPKRPAADNINDRSIKRRSARACLSCRSRKVRCDVENCGTPCNNCRLDGFECILTESNRGKRNVDGNRAQYGITDTEHAGTMDIRAAGGIGRDTSHHASTSSNASRATMQVVSPEQTNGNRFQGQGQQTPQPQSQTRQHRPRQQQRPRQHQHERHLTSPEPHQEVYSHHPSPRSQESRDYLVSLSFDNGRSADKPVDQRGHQPGAIDQDCDALSTADGAANISPDGILDAGMGSGYAHNHNSLLPSYIRPPPRHIAATDMAYLAEKGALCIPDIHFRNHILTAYVDIVHPFLPAIDLGDLLNPIASGGTTDSPISLLLFQCVMFAGVTFADEDILQKRGYQDRREAREVFFRRVRLLYGLDYEVDRLVLVQSLLLMTYWFGGPDDAKDTWHWSGNAISLAQECGLHRDPEHMQITASEKQLRRRIWWSCYIRDRLIALGIRRPARLSDDQANVPMLDISDFEPSYMSSSAWEILGPSSLHGQGDACRRAAAMTCVELVRLCVCLGRILHSQYSVIPDYSNGSTGPMKFAVLPKPWEIRSRKLDELGTELDHWLKSLDARCQYKSVYPRSAQSNDRVPRLLRLHQMQLHMIFLTTVGVLHRPQVFCSAADAAAISASRRTSRSKLRDAAKGINKLAFDLRTDDLLPFLSTSGIPAFLSAAIIHLLDIQSNDEEVSNVSIGRFCRCVEVLKQLQNMYVSADAAVGFLDTVVQMVGVKIPAMALGLRPSVGSHTARPAQMPQVIPTNGLGRAAYATPSATASQSMDDGPPRNLESSFRNSMQQRDLARNPPITNAEDLGLGSTGLHNSELLTETSFMDSWDGVEGLFPALMNVDVGAVVGDMNGDAMASFDWGLTQVWNSPDDVSGMI